MGAQNLTKTENNEIRRLCRKAVDSGDFDSYCDLGKKAGIGETTLYPFMKGKSGLSPASAEGLAPVIEKYRLPHEQRLNGHSNGQANGHSNGIMKTPTVSQSFPHVSLTKTVLEKLFELYEETSDTELRDRIDSRISGWAVEGLEIITSALAEKTRG
jgi:hypothetical protein